MAPKALPPAHLHFSRVPIWPEGRKWLKDHPSEKTDYRLKVSWQDFQIDIESVQGSTNWRYGCESAKCLALKLPLVVLGGSMPGHGQRAVLTMSSLLPLTGLLLGFCCNPFRPWGGFPPSPVSPAFPQQIWSRSCRCILTLQVIPFKEKHDLNLAMY